MLKKITEQLSTWILLGTKFLSSKFVRRTLYSFSIVAILVGVFLVASPAKADYIQDFANGIINGLSYILIEIAAIFIQLTIFSLKFFIEIAGYNNFIDADIVKLGWNMIRDVANMFFVVFLLVIAFGTILGLEQYEWKKTLIKLIMSAFLVNFSNLICQLIIDISQVFTITFLNAVAGAAGGNLIKMFNLDEIYNIANNNTDPNGLQIKLFGGAVMTIIFAGMAMFTMGAYLVVILARMVVLWALMIFSPLAFLFAALPNTQQYAKQFWDKFVSHVIAAPVMVFFLWLAFATFGGGNVVQENIEREHPLIIDGGIQPITQSTDNNGNSLGITYSQAASWENMANFAVAIAFLAFGIQQVSSLGVVGGGLVSGAINFGKNVATIASGYAVGRWLVGKGKSGLSSAAGAVGKGLYTATLANTVEIAKNRVNREIEGWKDWRARGPNPETKKMKAKPEDFQTYRQDANGNYLDKDGTELRKDADGKMYRWDKEKNDFQYAKKDGKIMYEFVYDKDGRIQFEKEDTRNPLQKMFYERQERLVKSRKKLEKVQKEKDVREQLMDKRITAIPQYLMQNVGEKNTPDAFDRMEQGMLEAETMRSAAKTEEFKALGKQLVLSSARFKDGKWQTEKPTLEQQVVQHKEAAARTEALVKESQTRARKDYIADKGKGAKIFQGKIRAELETKTLDAEGKKTEAFATTETVKNNIDIVRRRIDAEKSAITPDLERQAIEKQEETAFLKEEAVQSDLRREAISQARIDAANAFVKQQEAEAARDVASQDFGKKYVLDRITSEKAAHDAELEKQAVEKEQELKYYNDDKHRAVHDAALEEAIKSRDSEIKEAKAEGVAEAVQTISRTDVAKRVAADAITQAAQAEVKQAESAAKQNFDEGINGREAAQRVERAAIRTEEADTRSKELQAEAKARANKDLASIIESINLSQQGIVAAENFVKKVRDEDLSKNFEKAAKAILDAFKKGGTALNDLAKDNVYVRALKTAKELSAQQEVTTVVRSEAETKAEGAYVDLKSMGYTTPSPALVAVSKRLADGLNSLTNEALGKALTDNLALVARDSQAKGKLTDLRQHMASFGTINKVNAEAYIDDTFDEMVNRLNLKLAGKIKDPEEMIKLQALEDVWVKQLGLIQAQKDGNGNITGYVGDFEERGAGMMQNYVISGGNVAYVKKHQQIAEAMASDSTLSYKSAIEKVITNAQEKQEFLDTMRELDTFTQDAAGNFKSQALATGHRQNGGHQKFDSELGLHRFSTDEEARAIMQAEMRKRGSKVGYQHHSLGTLRAGVLKKVDTQHFADTVGQAKTYLEIKQIQDRTRDSLMGYQPSKDKIMTKDGYGELGADKEEIKKRYGSVEKFMEDVLLPQLAGGAKAFGLTAFLKFDNVEKQDAERGKVKVSIAGTNIKADRLDTLIDDIQKHLSDQGVIINAQLKKQLDESKKALVKSGTNRDSGQTEPDEEDTA